MLFFLLKDKEQMLNAVRRVLPRNRGLAGQVWVEMNQQITNYIRGKVLEMVIVGIATYLVFFIMGMNYALLLAVLVGFSVLIPYIGAVIVTICGVGCVVPMGYRGRFLDAFCRLFSGARVRWQLVGPRAVL